MATTDHNEELRKAELKKIHAEIALLESDRDKIELEKSEIVSKSAKKWWSVKASGLIQAVIGGIVAGALVAGFGLDHFLKISDLNEKSQKVLQTEKNDLEISQIKLISEKQRLENQTKALEERARLLEVKQEESRQVITSLRNENSRFKDKTEATLEKLSNLSISSSQRSEDSLNNEIASLRSELVRVKVETESREQSLNTELQNLSKEHEKTSKGIEDNWFPVIASPYNETDLIGKLEELDRLSLNYPVHVYKTADKRGVPVYAITLAGYLPKSEASKRVAYVRKIGIAKDAYPWSSNLWGNNIIGEFVSN